MTRVKTANRLLLVLLGPMLLLRAGLSDLKDLCCVVFRGRRGVRGVYPWLGAMRLLSSETLLQVFMPPPPRLLVLPKLLTQYSHTHYTPTTPI